MAPSLLPSGSQRLGSMLSKATHTDKAGHPGFVRPMKPTGDASKYSSLHTRNDKHNTCFCQCLLLLLHYSG